MQNKITQNLLYTGIILIAVFSIFLYKPASSTTPQGIVLPVSNFYQPISINEVNIINSIPVNTKMTAKTIAHIHLELNGKVPLVLAEKELLKKAKTMAANIGADAIQIQEFGFVQDKHYGLTYYAFKANAIHTEF